MLETKTNVSYFQPKILPPYVGMKEGKRKDGSYGYKCNVCGYPVGDHDGYCSECGARVGGTLFYYGYLFEQGTIPCIPIKSDDKNLKVMTLEEYQKAVNATRYPGVDKC